MSDPGTIGCETSLPLALAPALGLSARDPYGPHPVPERHRRKELGA
jgi:hypothetical protein